MPDPQFSQANPDPRPSSPAPSNETPLPAGALIDAMNLPTWITPAPRLRHDAAAHVIPGAPDPAETGLESWLRILTIELQDAIDGDIFYMLLAHSHPRDPLAWFFTATIGSHRIHVIGYPADPSDAFSSTRHLVAIDGLQIDFLPLSGPHLREQLVHRISQAHQHLAHCLPDCTTGTYTSPSVPDHETADRYQKAIAQAEVDHAKLFSAVRAATGLEPSIWQSGGMVMTMYVPVPASVLPGSGHYLGLVETWDENGHCSGSISWYADDETDDSGGMVMYANFCLPVTEWADAIRRHLQRITETS